MDVTVKLGFQESVKKTLADFPDGEGEVTQEMEGIGREVLDDLAVTGVLCYEWPSVRKVLVFFVRKSIAEFSDNPIDEQFVKKSIAKISSLLESANRPIFTLQRICEIVLHPRDIYSSLKKYLYAVEKVLDDDFRC